jgi:glycosyltransferase involved in cell wall biosynthesis
MSVISIIVPIYNVEKYLRDCMDSLINQSYKNLEIILVDDGSNDSCGELCEEYALNDSRIKVVHKINAGLGRARNTGLSYATGEYIYFLDSDDWLELRFFERMLRVIEDYGADMVICGFNRVTDKKVEVHNTVSETSVFSNDKIIEDIFLPMIGRKSTQREDYTINMCVWTNLYKKSIIDENKIEFLSEREYLSEDICFNLKYLYYSKKVVMIPDCLYNYRNNPISLTNCYKDNEYFMIIRLYNEILKMIKALGLEARIEYRLHRFFLTKTRQTIALVSKSKMPLKDKRKIIKVILEDDTLQRTLKEYPIHRYVMKYKLPAVLMKYKLVVMTIELFTLKELVK